MIPCDEWIETSSFIHLEEQKKACANVRKSDGDWSTNEEDAYTMGYETGCRAMAKEWAKRFQAIRRHLWNVTMDEYEYHCARELNVMTDKILK